VRAAGADGTEPLATPSLGTLLRLDQLACAAGVVTLLTAFVVFERDPLLLVEAAMVSAAGVVLEFARRPLRRGDHVRVVSVIAVVSWLAFLGPVVITPFVEPVILLAALIPVVLAVPHVSSRRLAGFVACATGTSLLTLVLTRSQDLPDAGDRVPGWLTVTVVLVFAPFLTAMIGIISRHNHVRLQRALADAQASRARLAVGIDRERRRIERDLHDGAQQRLLALTLDLAAARALLDRDPIGARALLAALEDDAARAAADLRDLAHGVYPAVLGDHGLAAALRTAAARGPRPCRVDADGLGRLPIDVESTVYFCCLEAVHNASKHGGEGVTIAVRVGLADGGASVAFEVADDGRGFDAAAVAPGNGLAGLADRVGAAGGTLEIGTAPDRGVTVRGTIPLGPFGGPRPSGPSGS
jgi:signal transduction histidine kinase